MIVGQTLARIDFLDETVAGLWIAIESGLATFALGVEGSYAMLLMLPLSCTACHL
jgi:hypothetical protein